MSKVGGVEESFLKCWRGARSSPGGHLLAWRSQGADTPAWLAMLGPGSPTGGFWVDRQVAQSAAALLPLHFFVI